jgi:hypothetical protein
MDTPKFTNITALDRDPTTPNKKRAGLLATAGVLATVALTACAPNNTSSENVGAQPVIEKEVETEQQGEILSGEALTKHFEIPADKTGEDLANAFLERENEWTMYGAYPGITADALETNGPLIDYFEALTEANQEPIIEGLFTDTALQDPGIQNYLADRDTINFNSVFLFGKTSPEAQDSRNIEPYVRKSEVDNFKSSVINSDGSETINFTAETITNTDLNTAIEQTEGGSDVDGERREFTATFVNEDGTKKINQLVITTIQ